MDSIDEFEMKPLTAGLGFHKRSVSLKEHVSRTSLGEHAVRRALPSAPPDELTEPSSRARSSRELIEELHEALKNKPKAASLSSILPRDRQHDLSHDRLREIGDTEPLRSPVPTPEPNPAQPNQPMARVKFQIPDKTIQESTGTRRGAHDNLVKPLSPIAVSLPALLLDALIVLALALIFVVCLIVATGIKLPEIVAGMQGEFTTQLSLFVLYLAVFGMYTIVARSFFSSTIGEWTFDLQLGNDNQVTRAYYPALVLWRSVMNLVTGLIVLPVLSLLINRDLAARLSGLQLYKKNGSIL